MAEIVKILKLKPIRYWLEALALICIGVFAGHYASSHKLWRRRETGACRIQLAPVGLEEGPSERLA